MFAMNSPRVLIVSFHASARFGGEAALPLHYFRILRDRGCDVWLISHARTRDELSSLFPDEKRIVYIEDTRMHRLMWRAGRRLPSQIAYFTTGFIGRFAAQLEQRRLVRYLVAEHGVNIVHQPMPVSPREPSMMYGFGVPVIIGPMNGGMDYPQSFRQQRGTAERAMLWFGRWSASALNWLMPGKRHAAYLLVANQRTRNALPAGVCERVVEMVENGVDLSLWRNEPPSSEIKATYSGATFAFVGRLIDWKAVDLLLLAFQRASTRSLVRLVIMGDGNERPRLETLARSLGVLATEKGQPSKAYFAGWLSQDACARELQRADCLVLPSLLECGGAVVLEAMSTGKSVIATAWGGPADYLDDSRGILVPPTDRETLIEGFTNAMVHFAASPSTRREIGRRGCEKVVNHYDWELKVDQMISIYEQALAHTLA